MLLLPNCHDKFVKKNQQNQRLTTETTHFSSVFMGNKYGKITKKSYVPNGEGREDLKTGKEITQPVFYLYI